MKKILLLTFALLAVHAHSTVAAAPSSPMKVDIVGLAHGHIEFAFRGGS